MSQGGRRHDFTLLCGKSDLVVTHRRSFMEYSAGTRSFVPELEFLDNHVHLVRLSCNNLNAGWSGKGFPDH